MQFGAPGLYERPTGGASIVSEDGASNPVTCDWSERCKAPCTESARVDLRRLRFLVDRRSDARANRLTRQSTTRRAKASIRKAPWTRPVHIATQLNSGTLRTFSRSARNCLLTLSCGSVHHGFRPGIPWSASITQMAIIALDRSRLASGPGIRKWARAGLAAGSHCCSH